MASNTTKSSDLGDYLQSELYDNWAKDRKKTEEKWERNEDAFNGVSSAFWKAKETEDWRSNTFIMLTKIKVLTAYSLVIDMVLRGGRLPFALALSPWDQIIMEDLPPDEQEILQDSIDDMTGLIHQQVLDCKGDAELMKCVMAAAKLGETYWQSFSHEVIRRGFRKTNAAPVGTPGIERFDRFKYYQHEIMAPAFKYVSCWDMFRDGETDDMQKSRGYCHRDHVSPYDLRELKGEPYYLDDAIDEVIDNYSSAVTTPKKDRDIKPGLRKITNKYNTIVRKTFWCRVPRNILENFEQSLQNKNTSPPAVDFENDGDEVEIGAVMAEDKVIRLFRPRPESRPHGRVVWEINLDGIWGIGVADNVESIQMSLNGMVRAFEDNKKLSANIMAAIKKSLLIDWSGKFTPGELFEIAEEAKSAAEAIQQIIFQDVGDSLLGGIGLMERYGDEVSMLPKILQGAMHEKQRPDTLGEMNILQANAGKYIGSVIKNFDEGMIEPIVSRFYEYNMLDEAVTKGKGNYIAKPQGFSSFQDKVIRLSKVLQALQLIISSPQIAAETKLKNILEQVFRAFDIDPQQIFKTKEEKEADAQAMGQARQQALDEQGVVLLSEYKAKLEVTVAKIQEEHKAKLAEIEEEHLNKLEQLETESENRIVEKKVAGAQK